MHPRYPLLMLIFLLAACTAAPQTQSPALSPQPPQVTVEAAPRATAAVQSTPTTAPTVVLVQVCSPLEGFTLEQMPSLVSNPYHPPPPGSDNPHHGVDLADMLLPNRIALAGRSVQAALSGRVAAVIRNRFPFGNALIIETPLDTLPPAWLGPLSIPTPGPTLEPHSALTCPAFQIPAEWDLSRQSLYILYAHMQETPTFQPGEAVTCGQPLGAVGQTGNALNPHLHFEVRSGPRGARLSSLAHYDVSASLDEMAAYCTWSISGLFQMFDPLSLLAVDSPAP
jgi:murein DD-endopeptidase MepM/ murein hydrolase activator NlpD